VRKEYEDEGAEKELVEGGKESEGGKHVSEDDCSMDPQLDRNRYQT